MVNKFHKYQQNEQPILTSNSTHYLQSTLTLTHTTKWLTAIYQILHRRLKLEQQNPHKKTRGEPIVLLLLQTSW
jgi:hypothetical protein